MVGNTTVTLYSTASGQKSYELNLASYSTQTQNQFNANQTQTHMSWLPIRRSEMMLQFSVIWPYVSTVNSNATFIGYEGIDPRDGFARMNAFQDAVRQHHTSIIYESTRDNYNTPPMVLTYNNNSGAVGTDGFNSLISQEPLKAITVSGWIQQVQKQYIRKQSAFMCKYTMQLMTPSEVTSPSSFLGQVGSFAPTTFTQNSVYTNGTGTWLNIDTLYNYSVKDLKGLPNSTILRP